MATASWNGALIAQSDDTIIVEGNLYFPSSSLDMKYFRTNDNSSYCPWKGYASYYDVMVDGEINPSAAWYYSDPKEKAASIKDHIAFWNGVVVSP